MSMGAIWPAPLLFLEDLWRGCDRWMYAPALVGEITSGRASSEGPFASWLAGFCTRLRWIYRPEAGEENPGAASTPLSHAAAELSRTARAALFIDVSAWLQTRFGGEEGFAGVEEFERNLRELLALAPRLSGVALWAQAGAPDPSGEDPVFDAFVEWVEDVLPNARLFASGPSNMATIFGLGGLERDEEGNEGEVAIDYDNRLADAAPHIATYVAVSARTELPTGLTLIELPAALRRSTYNAEARAEADPETSDDSAWAGGLAADDEEEDPELREDPAALDRELEAARATVESLEAQLESAESRIYELEEELEDLRDPPGATPGMGAEEGWDDDASEPATHVQAAERQRLVWEVERLRAEVAQLRGRPADALEVEIERLRQELRGISSASAEDATNEAEAAVEETAEDEPQASTMAADAGIRDFCRTPDDGFATPIALEAGESGGEGPESATCLHRNLLQLHAVAIPESTGRTLLDDGAQGMAAVVPLALARGRELRQPAPAFAAQREPRPLRSLIQRLDHVIVRVERGGMTTPELHGELTYLRTALIRALTS